MSVLSHINGPRGNGHNFLEENFPLTKIQQQAESRNLRIEIIDGLRSESRYLPSILQWDAEGLRLFEDITRSAAYYPTGAEIDILRSHADEMTKRVKSGSNVVELGGGNMLKTRIFLEAIARQKKHIDFYVLDLCETELRRSLSTLIKGMGHSPYITFHGLVGSYDGLAVWRQQSQAVNYKPQVYLWLGNSIANHTPQEATALMTALGGGDSKRNAFTNGSKYEGASRPSFFIAVDNCFDPALIHRAYDMAGGQNRDFILNGLRHANTVLGYEAFCCADWSFQGEYDEINRRYRSFYLAQRDTVISIAGDEDIPVPKGERVHAIDSRKWDIKQIQKICKPALLACTASWQNERIAYGMYLLEPLE